MSQFRDDERTNRIFTLFLIAVMIAFLVGASIGSGLVIWLESVPK